MQPGDFSDTPNPFASASATTRRSKRGAVVKSLKFLLLAGVGLAATLALGSYSQQWLSDHLAADFDTLSPEQKQTRLVQLSELGVSALPPMVKALADPDIEVARTAYNLVRQLQNDWTVLAVGQQRQRHATLVEAISAVAVHVPDDRTGWVAGLLQQTVLATVQRRDEESRLLYRQANHALEMLSLSDRSGPSILADETLDSSVPQRVTVRSRPLPVDTLGTDQRWTDWPPPHQDVSSDDPSMQTDVTPPDQSATVLRSTENLLQPVDPDQPVILRDVDGPIETAHVVDQVANVQSVTHLIDSPLQTLDDRSVMHWLGSVHHALRDQAREELTRRGFDATSLAIATQLAGGDVAAKLELIEKISQSDQIDPRSWLLMMLSEPDREVRLRAVSVLATMDDPEIRQRLRSHLVEERDLLVGAKIRRVLDLR